MTINWNKLDTEPRFSEGDNSAKYVGIKAEEAPTAKPRTIRDKINVVTPGENADPIAPIKKIIDDSKINFLRPYLSDIGPIIAAPRTAPSNTELTTQP